MYNLIYFIAVIVLVSGLYIMLTSSNYVRKLIGLGVFQTSVLVFYIALGKVKAGIPPVLSNDANIIYTNPLPHVLMLTAIVVGFATLSVGLALIHRIYEQFGTIEEDEIVGLKNRQDNKG